MDFGEAIKTREKPEWEKSTQEQWVDYWNKRLSSPVKPMPLAEALRMTPRPGK